MSIENIAIKIASRCNLNCTYCYIYNQGDSSYQLQPKFMSKEVYETLIKKIRNYCYKRGLTRFTIILFGGEPLLAGKKYISELVKTFKEALEPDIQVSFGMQTNGTMIDEEWLSIFIDLNIGFGISLDGSKEINDTNRVDFKNNGTYDRVIKGINLVKKANLPVGIISFLNIYQNPIDIYKHFKKIGATSIDFLFPDANYYQFPPGVSRSEGAYDWSNTPYGDWYIKLFDYWFYDKKPKPRIRYLNYLLRILLGNDVGYDQAGTQPTNLVMIESNGDIEAVDDLRVCGDGFTKSKLNIVRNTFFDAEDQKLIKMHMTCKQKLAKQCKVCPAVNVCGAGYLPSRYGKKNGFNNPSVYCPDLLKIITHVRNVLIKTLSNGPARLEDNLEVMTYDEAINHIVEGMEMCTNSERFEYEEELTSFKEF